MKKIFLFFIVIFTIISNSIKGQYDTIITRNKNKIIVTTSLSYFWDNEWGHPYYEIIINQNIYYYPWSQSGFGYGLMNIITNDITDKSHLRYFYFNSLLYQFRFLKSKLYAESGISLSNYAMTDSATLRVKPEIYIPVGFGFNPRLGKKLNLELSMIEFYNLKYAVNTIIRIGITYSFN